MQAKSKKIHELQQLISKMPLEVCWTTLLPEIGVRWREVTRAVRNARLPMAPVSVARVLCKHASRTLTDEDIAEIVVRLRLKLATTQDRKWFVIDLLEPVQEQTTVAEVMSALPRRVAEALKKSRSGRMMQPQIQTVLRGDFLYMSVQMVSDSKEGPVLYVAIPRDQPVALVSSLTCSLLKSCVEGLGYRRYEDAMLSGRDAFSLLRIHDKQNNSLSVPEYNPQPVVTRTGIDYTNKAYDEEYVKDMLGPDPPLLTELTIKSTKSFFDPSRLNKKINLTVHIKSEDIAQTLKAWVVKGALSPTSDLFSIFHKIKSNKINFQDDEE